MNRRTKTALGVDLGESHLGVALVEKGPQGFRTLATAREDWSATEPGQSPGKVLSRLLAQLGRRARLCGTRVAVAVSSDPLVVRLLDLPAHVPANIGAFVRNELQQYVALSGKTIVSDFCGVGAGVQKRLLTAAADGDRVQEMVKACAAAGIVVDSVEPALLAYARAFLEREKEARHQGHVLIALLGARTLTIGLWRQGTLDFVRTRALPADTDTPRPLCAWLAEELKAVVRYGETQVTRPGRDGRIQVVLDDGRHRADEIAPLLAVEVGTRSLTVVAAGGPAKDDPSAPGTSSVAEGAALALLGAEHDDLKINLLPRAVTEARLLSRHLLLTANVCVLIFLGVFAAAQLLARTTDAVDHRIEQSRLSGELYAAPALFAKGKYLDQEISGMRQRVDPLRKAMKGRHRADWAGILQAVRQAAPAEVSVTQFQCGDGRSLCVKGFTASCPAADVFVRNLERQPPFTSVSLATLQRQPDGGRLEYRIDCLLKVKGGPSS